MSNESSGPAYTASGSTVASNGAYVVSSGASSPTNRLAAAQQSFAFNPLSALNPLNVLNPLQNLDAVAGATSLSDGATVGPKLIVGSTVTAGGVMNNITASGGGIIAGVPNRPVVIDVVSGQHYSNYAAVTSYYSGVWPFGGTVSSTFTTSALVNDSAAGTIIGATALSNGTIAADTNGALVNGGTALAGGTIEADASGATVENILASGSVGSSFLGTVFSALLDPLGINRLPGAAGAEANVSGAVVIHGTAADGGDVGARASGAIVSDSTALLSGTVLAASNGALVSDSTALNGGAVLAGVSGATVAGGQAANGGFMAALTGGAILTGATANFSGSIDGVNGGTLLGGVASSGGVAIAGGAGITFFGHTINAQTGYMSGVTIKDGGMGVVGGAQVSATKGGRQVNLGGGGFGSDGVVDAGGFLDIAANGTQNGGQIGGSAIVQSGATLNSALFSGNAGTAYVGIGGHAGNNSVESGATFGVWGGAGGNNTALSGGVISVGMGQGLSLINNTAGLTDSNGKVPPYIIASSGVQGGVASGDVVSAGGTETVGGGGTSINVTVSGGLENVDSGGVLGGTANIAGGGGSNGTLVMNSGATANVVSIGSGGIGSFTTGLSLQTIYVGPSGTAIGVQVSNGMVVSVAAGGVAQSTYIGADGETPQGTSISHYNTSASAYVASGGTLSGATIAAGNGNGSDVYGLGGLVVVESGATLTDTYLGKYGQIEINNINSAAGESVALTPAGSGSAVLSLMSDGVAVWTGGLTGTYDPKGFQIWNDNGKAVIIYDGCFLAGAMIRTPTGEVAVEKLREGDEVLAYVDGRPVARQITAVYQAEGSADLALPRDLAGWPICVKAGAFGEGLPVRDLRVTGEHSFWFDGRFVPARMLVNGSSIFYDTALEAFTYYHVATEPHSVIWADGVLTESWLDTDRRREVLEGADGVARVDFVTPHTWEKDAAAPLETGQHAVEPLWQRFASRAAALGYASPAPQPLVEDADLRVRLNNGVELRPTRRKGQQVFFQIPAHAQGGMLVSRIFQPSASVGPWLDDRRLLGVLVGKISLHTGEGVFDLTEHLEEAHRPGWDVVEASPCRWTNGNALLPWFGEANRMWGGGMLVVEILAGGPYDPAQPHAGELGRSSGAVSGRVANGV